MTELLPTKHAVAIPECSRLAAHTIIYQGNAYEKHFAFLAPDGTVEIRPLTEEIHSTVFINGTVGLMVKDRRLCYVRINPG